MIFLPATFLFSLKGYPTFTRQYQKHRAELSNLIEEVQILHTNYFLMYSLTGDKTSLSWKDRLVYPEDNRPMNWRSLKKSAHSSWADGCMDTRYFVGLINNRHPIARYLPLRSSGFCNSRSYLGAVYPITTITFYGHWVVILLKSENQWTYHDGVSHQSNHTPHFCSE